MLHLTSYTDHISPDHISPVKHYPGKDKDSKEGDSKKKTVKSAKSKKEPETPIIPVSDGEFKEKQPPKSLVAMHKDNIDSSVSITKKKGSQSGINLVSSYHHFYQHFYRQTSLSVDFVKNVESPKEGYCIV